MKASVTRNLQIGFSLSLLLLILSSLASYISIHNLLESSDLVNHSDSIINRLDDALSAIKDAETGVRGYLLTNNMAFVEPYSTAYNKVIPEMKQVKQLTANNVSQQENLQQLRPLVNKEFTILQQLIAIKKNNSTQNKIDLQTGKSYMDSIRSVILRMKDEEKRLLASHTANLNKLATFTPVLIILAAILALIITVFFYLRVNNEFKYNDRLRRKLQQKDEDTYQRIGLVQDVAKRISEGDYETRIDGDEEDSLGSLASSLNKMAEALDISFKKITDNEWLQEGIAKLNEQIIGLRDIEELTQEIIEFIATYSECQAGALYLKENEDTLAFKSGYAFKNDHSREYIKFGEGLAGQCALTGKPVSLNNINESNFTISFAMGEIKPPHIIAIPICFENKVSGVIELASLKAFTSVDFKFFIKIAENIGIAINTVQNYIHLQDLLEETQSQAEELVSQQSELENVNTELEAQTEKLQASEEELRVQQEELLQTNQELEERTKMLEGKNELIVLRNLEVQKKAEELALSTKYKSEFLANMSHELRTPLNSILLLSRLLAENNNTNLTDEQIEYAKVIQGSGNGLLELIDEILDLSKIESGKMEVEIKEVQVAAVLDDMKGLFEPLAREKNVNLDLIKEEGVSDKLETDKSRLEQILKNLLSNALKFTSSKGDITLKVATSPLDKGYINFSVKDTGIGIPKEKQALVFEAFQQADGSTQRKYGGTGLGLSICRQLSRLLGGDITLESEPEKGSKFTLSIPLHPEIENKPEEEKKLQDIKQLVKENRQEDGRTNSKRNPQFIAEKIPPALPDDREVIQQGEKSVLIVEDDTAFAKILLDHTRKQGYKGIVTVRGDKAVRLAETYLPSGILLDIQLPVKSGWEVMEELKNNPVTKHIPVHIISSFEIKKESISKGAVDAIRKPLGPLQLNNIFEKLDFILNRQLKKALIIEDDPQHANALSYYLSSHQLNSETAGSIEDAVNALRKKEIDCVILDTGTDIEALDSLEALRRQKDLKNIPVIIFTGKNISKTEEVRIKQYADSIVVKTANSYKRILNELTLFLHLMDESKRQELQNNFSGKAGALKDILKGKKVLIADDDVRNIFSLTKALENHHMEVKTAIDGKEALAAMQREKDIDIVLLDMMMPEMDGYETLERIRKDTRFKGTPVIAVTAKAMAGDKEKCIQAGASDYISKPVDIDQLISLLRVWLYENYQ